MNKVYNSESDSDVSVGSDTRGSSLSLQYSRSTFGDSSSRDSHEDFDCESGRVEPYQYKPEDSEEESTVAESGGGEGGDSRREWLHNTNYSK